MRTIKFRAWDTKYKWMDEPDGYDLYLTNSGLVDVSEQGCWDRYLDRNWHEDKRYVLMQYTDLKDKNGKEIYEGDLVRNNDLTWEIYWGGGCYKMAEEGRRSDNDHLFIEEAQYSEVIGNKYENPDHVKGQ